MILWLALACPLEVPIQKLAQGCPVPPGQTSEPDEQRPGRQYENADGVSVEQYNGAENRGRRGGEKGDQGAASQEQAPQCSIKVAHWIHGCLQIVERLNSAAAVVRWNDGLGVTSAQTVPNRTGS
jgi:hypothetical protein